MRLLFKIVLMSFVIAVAQADQYEGDGVAPSSSDFIVKTHLSCIVSGLKKAGRPAPDEHFLAMMGLLVRENTSLFEDERDPKFKNQSRRSMATNQSVIKQDSKGRSIEFTTRAQVQKNTMQLLLASGYCTQGKIKSKSKDTNYSNYIERMNSDLHPVLNSVKDIRKNAIKELGHNSWGSTQELFLYDDGASFFALPFEKQQEFYTKKRKSALAGSTDRYDKFAKTDIPDCLRDIKDNYIPAYSSAEDTYTACKAIYDECGIASNPNAPEGTDGLYFDTAKRERVGGDWCASKYKTATVAPGLTKSTDAAATKGPASSTATVPAQPTTSFEVIQQGNTYTGPRGSFDASKMRQLPNGDYIIPKDAIYQNPNPSGVEVKGQQRPAATK